MISKTYIEVDDTWTIDDFRDTVPNADEILEANGLPNQALPFGTIAEQLSYQADTTPHRLDTTPEGIQALFEMRRATVAKNASDLLYAREVASWGDREFDEFIKFDSHPQFLKTPEDLCDRSAVFDRAYYYDDIMACNDIGELRELLDKLLPDSYKPQLTRSIQETPPDPADWFWENRGEVTFTVHDSSGEHALPIPCWPEQVSDNTSATWSQEMTTFQHYEPWQTYKGSGPRTVSCTFKLHRAMWTGDQDSGHCEELISLFESAVYPDYDTQEADPPRCTLRVGQSVQIHGILTNLDKVYDGPIGPDTKYDCVTASLTIIEESPTVLSSKSVRSKQLSGWR